MEAVTPPQLTSRENFPTVAAWKAATIEGADGDRHWRGLKGAPGVLRYLAGKGAIIAMTRSLAMELGPDNVMVNAVSPGFTMTKRLQAAEHVTSYFGPQAIASRAIKREAVASDVAKAIYFFASDDLGVVTGQTQTADGGSVFH